MNRARRYSPEVRERAVRTVLEHQGEYGSQWGGPQGKGIMRVGPTKVVEYRWVGVRFGPDARLEGII